MEWDGIDSIVFHSFFINPNNGTYLFTIPFHPTPSHFINSNIAWSHPHTRPYLAASSWNYKPSLSTNILQHHLPNNAKLNSLILLTPKLPISLSKQMDCQSIQEIFLLSSHPRKKKMN